MYEVFVVVYVVDCFGGVYYLLDDYCGDFDWVVI